MKNFLKLVLIMFLAGCVTPAPDIKPIEPLIPVSPLLHHKGKRAGGLRASTVHRNLRSMRIPSGWTTPDTMPQSPYLLPSDDQGQTPGCTAYGMTGICEGLYWWVTGKKIDFDAHKLYVKEKQIDGDNEDGSTLETAILAAKDFGWLSFNNPEGRTVSLDVYDLTSIAEIKYALHRCPAILLGLNITEAWNSPKADGTICDTNGDSQQFIGGHCIILDSYDDYGPWIVNSWNLTYGVKGRIHLSWAQLKQQWMGAKGFLLRVQ